MTTKVNFTANGVDFKNITLKVYNQTSFYTTMMGVSQVVRQYIKSKYGVKIQIHTDSYSGGDSVSVYLSPENVSKDVYKKISKDVESTFQEGSFNSMEDIYEYSGGGLKTVINNKEIKFASKYVSVYHRNKI